MKSSTYDAPTFHYSLFGLGFRSNRRLPRVPLAEKCLSVSDCELHLGTIPEAEIAFVPRVLTYTSSFTDSSGEPALRIWSIHNGACFQLTYSDGHQFWLDRKGTHVWAVWPDSSSVEEAASYLLGPVLGVLLRYRGVVCLHASAVAINGQVVVFVGPPGAGKSTMAAAMAQRGYAVLADDIAAVEERDGTFYVHPAYPGVCLWPESIDFLYGSMGFEEGSVVKSDKKCLSTDAGVRFESRSLPLGSIYVLDYRNSRHPASVSGPSVPNVFLSLVANTYANNILDIQMRVHEFGVLGRIASQIPVFNVHSERSPVELQRCCDLICADEVLK